jgi:hypothetical protein
MPLTIPGVGQPVFPNNNVGWLSGVMAPANLGRLATPLPRHHHCVYYASLNIDGDMSEWDIPRLETDPSGDGTP